MNTAEPRDAELIADALDRSDELDSRGLGLLAARRALEGQHRRAAA